MLHTFERAQIDPNRLCGAIVSESDSLLLIHRWCDFEFDGYVVIRRRDITKSCSSDSDAYCERLTRKEGLWKHPPKSIRSLPIDSWHSLLSSLVGKPVIIENERKDDFHIGPIVDCEPRCAAIHYFNGCGDWLDVERVSFRRITCVQFGDRYSTIHYRNLPPRPNTGTRPRRRSGVN